MSPTPSPAITDDLLCPACGYMLRGLTEYRCPECGRPFDPAKLAPDPIPWTQRKRLGWIRAYVQTVMWSTFRVRRLSEQVRHPVSYRDAQLFRWVTAAILYAICVWGTISSCCFGGTSPLPLVPLPHNQAIDCWTLVTMHLAALLTLAAATALPSYFFHPRRIGIEQQNRCIALSYYTCGPVAWTPVVYPLGFVIGRCTASLTSAHADVVAGILIAGLLAAELLLWWRGLVHLSKYAAARQTTGVIMVGTIGPLLWVTIVVLVFSATKLVSTLLGLVYYSLRG